MINEDWTVQILAPTDTPGPPLGVERRDRAFQPYAGPLPGRRRHQVVEATVESLRSNWQEVVRSLTAIGDGIDDGELKWGVSQIEVGLTLGAKGQLLFIAEASAEASVKITLTRRATDKNANGA